MIGSLAAGVLSYDPQPAHLVGTGGAIGAVLRHWVYTHVSGDRFPWPTLLVNVLGSFLFGLVVFAGASESAVQFVGLGICGAFTTFSTFSVETVGLVERGRWRVAVAHTVGNLACSLAAIGLAWLVASVAL
ncbi:fluoride efflux transporter FluC [Halovivax gelatinilyticus]|uniref:fluoride efflux transporter FluC n=1 Tax=Halovivax gelatinilyticus TaxID=2961597 RepID=UPI0020CA406C|nr:CrcB family protein [Halovivax gelatinilyticus]